jgi:hypothetical protein
MTTRRIRPPSHFSTKIGPFSAEAKASEAA